MTMIIIIRITLYYKYKSLYIHLQGGLDTIPWASGEISPGLLELDPWPATSGRHGDRCGAHGGPGKRRGRGGGHPLLGGRDGPGAEWTETDPRRLGGEGMSVTCPPDIGKTVSEYSGCWRF